MDTFSSKTESPALAQSSSITTVDNTFRDPDKPFIHIKHLHNAQFSTACEKHLNEEAEPLKDGTFTKPLKQFNREASHVAHVSSLRSEYADKFEPSPIITETKSNGASVKKIPSEFENEPEDKSISDALIEENYMPMSPNKSVLAPRGSITSETNGSIQNVDSDENHYVEMTQKTLNSVLDGNPIEQQPYEMVCFSGGKVEPVYMELKNPEHPDQNSRELPDILMASKKNENHSNKSDSSDADDEASKDLNSLDTPTQPRFSLSDTFRPASYYLGASRAGPELHDSSDSELVSPPPIPPYPPPSVMLGHSEELFFNEIDKSGTRQKNPSISSTVTPQNNDSDVDLRLDSTANYDIDATIMKRRPVSEEFCSELASLDGTFADESAQSVDLDRYILTCNVSIASNDDTSDARTERVNPSFYEYENIVMRGFPNEMSFDLSANVFEEELNPTRIFSVLPANNTKSTLFDLSSIQQNSNCSTPVADLDFVMDNNNDISVAMYISEQRDQSFCPVPAPYYYSDLNINSIGSNNNPGLTLNNQRESSNGGKRDITHIINPIKCNGGSDSLENTFKLAAEARSASVDFLNLTDKSGSIDEKNIYESNTLKWQKTTRPDSNSSRNLYPNRACNKFGTSDNDSSDVVRRSHSLEGLLDTVTTQTPASAAVDLNSEDAPSQSTYNANLEGSYVWEEDSIWRERLRSASQRHTKSMEDLDQIGDNSRKKKKPSRGIIRGVTYVNDNFLKLDKQQKDMENEKALLKNDNDKKEGNFIIDREKLRQWDLLSSAPSDDQLSTVTAIQVPEGSNIVVDIGDHNCDSPDIADPQEAGIYFILYYRCNIL